MIHKWAVVSAIVVAGMFLGSVFVTAARDAGPAATAGTGPTPSAGSVPRTPLVEIWTNYGCPPCTQTDPALVRLMDEYESSANPPSFLMYHDWGPDVSDPFYLANQADLDARTTYYSVGYSYTGVPTVILDGGGPFSLDNLWYTGAWSGPAANYDASSWYRDGIAGRVADTTGFTMSVEGDLQPNSAAVRTTITALDPVTGSNLHYKLLLYEDLVHEPWTTGNPRLEMQRYVVRDMVEDSLLTISQGQTVVKETSFSVSPSFNKNHLGVVAMIQTDTATPFSGCNGNCYNHQVYQSAHHAFIEPSVLLIRDDGLTDYLESYDKELAQTSLGYRYWNTLSPGDTGNSDVRALPSASELARFPAVVWSTGADASGTLDSTEQSLVQGYLDSGSGNLFVSGENIADELWWTGGTPPTYQRSFVQNYLHSSWFFNTTSQVYVTGIAADPISGAWSGTQIPRFGSGPTRISPYGSATSTFDYCGTPCGTTRASAAAVKAEHDPDSRVVFMAYQYFEGSDSLKDEIMTSVISWLDGSDGPTAMVTYPTGGEIFMPGTTERITWDAQDVNIPTNGVDIYYTLDSANPTWTLIASGEPNDGVYSWLVPNVQTDTARIRVVARDMDIMTPDADVIDAADFYIGNYRRVDITFDGAATPMRLISFPVQLTDTNPSSVLSSALANVGTVRWYDSTDAVHPWKTWSAARGGDLTALNNKMGFWVELSGSNAISVTGLWPTTTTITLKTGWNLVGYPSDNPMTVAQLKTTTGATRVEGFDANAASYHLRALADSYYLQNTEGYWVYVPSDTVWIVAG